MKYQIRFGEGFATFTVQEDLIAVKEDEDVRGATETGVQDLVKQNTNLHGNHELQAFSDAGWAIGEPTRGSVRKQAELAERFESLDLRQILKDDDDRYYLDSGQVVASVRAPTLDAAIERLEDDGLSVLRELPLGARETADHILLARVATGRSTLHTVCELQDKGHYNYLEPDLIEHVEARVGPGRWTPQDPQYHRQWHWPTVDAEVAWNRTRGAGARIAIIDHGYQLDHPAFVGAVGWGGYFQGKQFVAAVPGAPRNGYPVYGHGTACAGMAVARSGVGGGCGIANQATFMPMACIGDQTGSQTTLAEALIYAALPDRSGSLGANVAGADVISCSLGPRARWRRRRVLSNAIETVTTEGRNGLGTLVVWAASNHLVPIGEDQVVSDPRVLAVGRTTRLDRHDNTAFGDGLDLVAPGVDVFTTHNGGRWGPATGCSFAAPIVAGVAGLVLVLMPDLTRDALRQHLLSACKKVGTGYTGAGRADHYGFGRIDAGQALRNCP